MATTITCDQAVFTSLRTPMGEGYRIVAASSGINAGERQAITRNSPSHEGLCLASAAPDDQATLPPAVSYYPLPGGRLCVAVSSPAGAEHTGRGGLRVYTHCAVVAHEDFQAAGYNPFNIVRAMVVAGSCVPRLSLPPTLPQLELVVTDSLDPAGQPSVHKSLESSQRRYILQELLDQRHLVVNILDHWVETAEAVLLGIPGPQRAAVSIGAGLRFSLSRRHNLDLLHETDGKTRTRVAGQPIEYIDPREKRARPTPTGQWLAFVDRHWDCGDAATLARRTGRAFDDLSCEGRERIGRIYNNIDEIASTDTADLFTQASEYLAGLHAAGEGDLCLEFLDAAKGVLEKRLQCLEVDELRRYWACVRAIRRSSEAGLTFAKPLIDALLRRMMTLDPLVAAEAALDLSQDSPTLAEARTNSRRQE